MVGRGCHTGGAYVGVCVCVVVGGGCFVWGWGVVEGAASCLHDMYGCM